jgi:hypothetical protein
MVKAVSILRMHDYSSEVCDTPRLVKYPLVSVLVVTYNHERYLAEAIEGVVRQETSFAVELLIGEDCSTDGTRKVALDYQKRFPEVIRVITSAYNVGGGKNLERLITGARGKYIAYCDGDDWWHRSDKLQRQVAVLEEDDAIILTCSSYRVLEEDGSITCDNHNPSVLGMREWLVYDELVTGQVTVATLTACARREAMVRTFLSSPACRDWSLPFGDLQLWLELSRQGRIRYVNEPLASYRQTRESASRSRDFRKLQSFSMNGFEVRDRFLARFPLASGPEATKAQRICYAKAQLRAAAAAGDAGAATCVIRRLREFGVDPGLREHVLICLARLPLGRYYCGPMAKSLLRFGRSLVSFVRSLRDRLTVRPGDRAA